MSSAAGADEGDDDIVASLMRTYPTPLNQLLVELYQYNQQAWLSGPMAHTLEAAFVRNTGLTPSQVDWAIGAAEAMGGDHPAFVDGRDAGVDVDPEAIESDTTAEDLFGGDLR